MQTIQFNAKNVEAFRAQLEEAKARLVKLCERTLDGGINCDISVVRYNMAREQLKQEFPVEVIGMLDASGFINSILCKEEQQWLREHKLYSLSPAEVQKLKVWEVNKKGGKS